MDVHLGFDIRLIVLFAERMDGGPRPGVELLMLVSANTLSERSRKGMGSSHRQRFCLIPAAFMASQAWRHRLLLLPTN